MALESATEETGEGIGLQYLGREWLSVAAPATVANLGVGFDVIGVAIKNIEDVDGRETPTFLGDIVHIKKSVGRRPLEITSIYVNGVVDSSLTKDAGKNVAGIAALEVRNNRRFTIPLEIILEKMPFMGSGMGSSAASVVSGAYAALLISGGEDKRSIADIVVNCEVGKHPDNVLPALFGGFVVSYGRTDDRLRLQSLYDPNVLALKQVLDMLRQNKSGIDYKTELEKARDSPAISEIIKKIEDNVQKVREYQKKQYYHLLLESLEHKSKLYGDKPRIQDAITIIKQQGHQNLQSLIEQVRSLGIREISADLQRIENYEKRRRKRIEQDRAYASPRIKKRLLSLVDESLKKNLGHYHAAAASADTQDYDKLEIPDDVLDKLYFVLIKPNISISTIEARARINKTPELGNVVANSRSLAKLLVSLQKGDLKRFGEAASEDNIVEPARAPLISGFYKLKDEARRAGAYGFTISGSGPACVGITDNIDVARKVARVGMGIFGQEGYKSSAYICIVDRVGARRL